MQGHAAQKGISRFLLRSICHLFTSCRQTLVLWDNICLREAEKYISEAFRDIITPSSPVQQLLCCKGGKSRRQRAPSLGEVVTDPTEEPSPADSGPEQGSHTVTGRLQC